MPPDVDPPDSQDDPVDSLDSHDFSPVSQDAYDELAGGYDEITGAAIREHYEWPAVRALIPALDGAHVLDAACGDGFYTERIVDGGATAVGVDANARMLDRARERLGNDDRVELHEGDLTDDLSFLDEEAFDLVVCQLALEHLREWDPVFETFERVLQPGGRVVLSTSHPLRDYVDAEFSVRDHALADGARYAAVERADYDWGEDEAFVVPFYRRPLQAVFEPATDAGFLVEHIVEPEVTDAFADARPEYAAQFREGAPNFLCLRLLKPTDVNGSS